MQEEKNLIKSSKKVWSQEEDEKLGLAVLRLMYEENYSQTEACEIASEFIEGRSAAACSTRWITNLREPFMRVYKYHQKFFKFLPPKEEMSMEIIIEFLQKKESKHKDVFKQLLKLQEKYKRLLKEHAQLSEEHDVFLRALASAPELKQGGREDGSTGMENL